MVVEEHAGDDDEPFSEIRASAARASVGGLLAPGGGWSSRPLSDEQLPTLLPGDVLRCTVDATRRRFEWRVVRAGATIAPRPAPPGGAAGPDEEPYSLPLCEPSPSERDDPRAPPPYSEVAAPHLRSRPPLALAVALKFANDSVSLCRV